MCLWHCRVIEPVCITGTNNERNIRPKRSPSPMMNSTAWAKKLLYVMTSKNSSYIKLFSMLFSTLSGVKAVKLIFWLSPYLDILCKVQRNHTTLKYPLMQTWSWIIVHNFLEIHNRHTNRKSTTHFPMNPKWTSNVVPKLPKGGGAQKCSVQNLNNKLR